MVPPPVDNPNAAFPDIPASAGSIIVSGLLELPSSANETQPFDPYRPLFACLLMAHLVRNSEHAKKLARELTFPSGDMDPDSAVATDDDDRVSLVQLVVGNLMMASREQTECVNLAAKEGKSAAGAELEEDWTRVMVGYLILLCTWLWDSPKTVKEFLSESANLQVVRGTQQGTVNANMFSSFSPSRRRQGSILSSRACPPSSLACATSSTESLGRLPDRHCTLSCTPVSVPTSSCLAWRGCARTPGSEPFSQMRSTPRARILHPCHRQSRRWRRRRGSSCGSTGRLWTFGRTTIVGASTKRDSTGLM